jgi:two pore calcium channel protein
MAAELKGGGAGGAGPRQGLLEKVAADPVDIAVVWVEKARSGSVQWVDSCSVRQLRLYRLKKQLKPLNEAVKYFLLIQAIFEYPSWCLYDTTTCPGNSHPEYAGSGAPVMPLQVSTWLNCAVLVYLLGFIGLRRAALGEANIIDGCTFFGYLHVGWRTVGTALAFIALVDDIVALTNKGGIFPGSFRICRLLRPFIFLCYTQSIRNAAARVVRSIKGFADALVALFICLFFFVWVGLMIFSEKGADSTQFPNWSDAFANLWILFTTANCPDAFVAIYTKHRLAIFFFFAYIVLSLYLLSNILLARVYDAYKEELKQMVIKYAENEEAAVNHAFSLLKNNEGVIDRERWAAFFKRYFVSHYTSGHEKYNEKRASMIFELLDEDHTQGISQSEFKSILDVLHDDDVYIPTSSPPELAILREWYRAFTYGVDVCGRRVQWDTLIDVVIFVGVLLAFIQTVLFVSGGNFQAHILSAGNPWWMVLFGFTCFYVIELVIKMTIMGFERFWYTRPFMNRFDLLNIFGLFILEIVCLATNATSNENLDKVGARLTVLLHIIRSLRLMRHIKPLNFIARMSVRIAPAYFRMGMVLMLVFYTYATVGVQWFGGKMYQGNPAVANTAYAGLDYWAFNFNDFNSGFVTCFVLLVVSNWQVFAGAFVAASGTKLAAGFFVSFFVITNLVVMNIFMAMILDCSSKIMGESGGTEDEDTLASKDTYVAMIRRALLDVEVHHGGVPDMPSRGSVFSEPLADMEEGEKSLKDAADSTEDYGATRG